MAGVKEGLDLSKWFPVKPSLLRTVLSDRRTRLLRQFHQLSFYSGRILRFQGRKAGGSPAAVSGPTTDVARAC